MSAPQSALRAARRVLHGGAIAACVPSAYAFERALAHPRRAQEARLEAVLRAIRDTELAERFGLEPGLSPDEFRARVPEQRYEDVAPLIERQRTGKGSVLTRERCDRYQPTSGSSSKVKWVPYTSGFLAELDAAVSPWGYDMYRCAPGARRGRHYWSLSWLPTHLRAETDRNVNDDRALLSWSKRIYSMLGSPVPSWVAYAPTSEDSAFATLAFLCAADDLSVMSVWSPTFALNLFEQLAAQRETLADVLEEGAWDEEHAALDQPAPRSIRAAQILRAWKGDLESEFFRELWPELAFVSAWDTSTSRRWAVRLAELLPHARFQGKGLWATEGVVTIPYRDRMPLAVRSHFYEFVDLNDGKPYFAWELRKGQEVRPLLTTSGGLLRYALNDRLIVRDRLHRTPTFEFLGRMGDVDMVGEKTSPAAASQALDTIASARCRPLSLLGVAPTGSDAKPRYVALCEGPASLEEDELRSDLLERALSGAFHYALARDLGQLEPARALTVPDARALYEAIGVARGMVRGNIKIEPLVLCGDPASVAVLAERMPKPSAHAFSYELDRRTP